MLVSERQRRERSDIGAVRQTARDATFLELMAHMYGFPLDLVARAADISTPRAYGIASRWKKAGWVHTGKVDVGPTWVWPTRTTARQYLGWDADWIPRATTTAHTRAVAAVRLHRVGLDLDRWESERELRHRGGWRNLGERQPHIPDGVEIQPDGRRALIEVELTAKSRQRYDKVRTDVSIRASEMNCDLVVYWCPPGQVFDLLTEVAAERNKDREEVLARARNPRYSGPLPERPPQQWFVRSLEEVPLWTVQG